MLIILCCYFYVLCLKGFVPSPDVFQNQFAPLLAQVPALTLLYVWKCYKERLRERNHGCCSLLSSYNLDLNTSVYLFIYLFIHQCLWKQTNYREKNPLNINLFTDPAGQDKQM